MTWRGLYLTRTRRCASPTPSPDGNRQERGWVGEGVRSRPNRDLIFDLLEQRVADALHVVDVCDLLEGAILGAIVDNSFGDRWADTGQLVELFSRGGVDVDHLARRGG